MKKQFLKVIVTAILCSLLIFSCGSPKAVVRVRNNAENTQTQVDIKTGSGGSTNVTVSPTATLDSISVDFLPTR